MKIITILALLVALLFSPAMANDKSFDAESFLQKKYAYNVDGNIEYMGVAPGSAATSDAKWKIQKVFYDESGNIVGIMPANGQAKFIHVWDDRATYTYPQ